MGRRRTDLTGQRFGSWTVLRFAYTNGCAYWDCRCDCGAEAAVAGGNLRFGGSTRCQDCAYAARRIDMVGKRFGKWTVVERAHKDNYGQWHWLCRCSCGTERTVTHGDLQKGRTTQCSRCSVNQRRAVKGEQAGRK